MRITLELPEDIAEGLTRMQVDAFLKDHEIYD
jgi:hypothetical protein